MIAVLISSAASCFLRDLVLVEPHSVKCGTGSAENSCSWTQSSPVAPKSRASPLDHYINYDNNDRFD